MYAPPPTAPPRRSVSTTALFGNGLVSGGGQPEPAGQHRVEQDAVALELEAQELAAPPDLDQPLPDEASELGGRAAHDQRLWCRPRLQASAGQGCRERRRGSPDRAAQARPPIVDAEMSVVTFAGPAGSIKKSARVPTYGGVIRAHKDTDDTTTARGPSVQLGSCCFPRETVRTETQKLTVERMEGTERRIRAD